MDSVRSRFHPSAARDPGSSYGVDAPRILYVRVERRALFPPQFQASDKLEDFRNSGPVATYHLAKVGHLKVERNLTNALAPAAEAPSQACLRRQAARSAEKRKK